MKIFRIGISGLALVVAGIGAMSTSARAATDNPTPWYLAIGDSVSAGLQPGLGVDRDGGFTGRVLAHVQAGDGKYKQRNLACEMTETSSEMLTGGDCTYEEGSQFAQALVFLKAHSDTTGLVTLTIGGNDIRPCISRPSVAEIQACVVQELPRVAANLSSMLRQIHAAAPGARVVVGNYYNPYIVHPQLGALSAVLAGALNSTIAQVATAYGDPVADVAAAFNSYDGDGTPSLQLAQATICQNTWMCSIGNIHPNDSGYLLYADAFIAEL